jgi:DNA-binding HxlR family transcriptional regulator
VLDLYFVGMRDYGQFCPVALGSEVLADRWTPLILREMVLGSTRFNDIERGLPGISRSLLAQRLKHLERKEVLERRPAKGGRGSEYHLTEAGRDLGGVVMALGEWAVRWKLTEPEPEEVDPRALTWWMHYRVDHDALPDRRVVIEFAYTSPERIQIWIVMDRGDVSVCSQHPGFDSDLVVRTGSLPMARVFNGLTSLEHAVSSGDIEILGPPALVKGFGRWFLWSPFREAVLREERFASA